MMDTVFAGRGSGRRRFDPRRLVWMAPLAVAVAVGLFFGLGNLVVWLWRATLVDIFAIKPIGFWQAWGLILLSQILFKANMQPTTRTGRWRRRDPECGGAPATAPQQPLHIDES
jgi:hypothetical protein